MGERGWWGQLGMINIRMICKFLFRYQNSMLDVYCAMNKCKIEHLKTDC